MTTQIIPAILTDDSQQAKDYLLEVADFAEWVQIDVMDGLFVPQESFELADLIGLPEIEKVSLEADLMVQRPQDYLEICQKVGFKRVYFHLESDVNVEQMINSLDRMKVEKGIALNPDTPVRKLKPYLDKIDAVLLLGVTPGSQGQKFKNKTLRRVKKVRVMSENIKIEVDGGVNMGNAKEIVERGVDYLAVGSAIFAQGEAEDNFDNLKSLTSNI